MKYPWMLVLHVFLLMITDLAGAHPLGPHVHGIAELQVTQYQGTLSIDLDSPLDSLLGFEHAPHNEKQKQAVQTMIEKLRHPEALFVLTSSAQCAAEPVQLNSPGFKPGCV
jgi:hypothetical protein